ncbi:MAG TPA: hypothetical protein VIL49_00495, partial [Capillimicrobium sp.]
MHRNAGGHEGDPGRLARRRHLREHDDADQRGDRRQHRDEQRVGRARQPGERELVGHVRDD